MRMLLWLGKLRLLTSLPTQFGAQEPDSPEEILKFVEGYGVNFTLTEKVWLCVGAATHTTCTLKHAWID